MDFSDRLIELLESGNDILGKLYFHKMALTATRRPGCLSNPDYQKIRSKFAKSFPAPVADIDKTPGWELYLVDAAAISGSLSFFRETYLVLSTFLSKSLEQLKLIPSLVTELRIAKNRSLLINYLELVSLYVKTLWLFASIEELKMVVSFSEYTVYYALPNQSRSNVDFGKTLKLISDAENLHLHLVSTFGEIYPFLLSCVIQLGDSITLGIDVSRLREEFILFPANDVSKINKASNDILSETNPTSRYNELQDFDRYRDFVLLAFLACPYLFFDSEAIEVFSMCAKSKHFIRITRDVSINFHIELEVLSYFFPASENTISGMLGMSQKYIPPANIVIPTPAKGFKLKNFFKETCRKATSDAGIAQRERRHFLSGVLRQWNSTLESYPGLVGPRLPQILATASLAKAEITEWFRQEKCFKSSSNGFRKDSKKYYVSENYTGFDVPELMAELSSLITRFNSPQTPDFLYNYYRDYILGIDRSAIVPLCEQLSEQLPHLTSYFESFGSCTDALSKINKASLTANIEKIAGIADTFRLNWLTCSAILATKNMANISKSVKNINVFFSRMQLMYNHFLYLDSFDLVMSLYVEPIDISWFRDELVSSFNVALENSTNHCFAHVKLLYQTISFNYSSKNSYELTLIEERMLNIANSLMIKVEGYLTALVKSFWDNLFALENQGSAFEAGKRIEKMVRAKTSTGANVDEAAPLPGFESESWAKSAIEKLVKIRCQISDLVASCIEIGSFNICGQSFNTVTTVSQCLEHFLEEHLILIFSSVGSELTSASSSQPTSPTNVIQIQLARPSTMLMRLKTLIHAIQTPLSIAKVDVTATIRKLMFNQCFDLSISPPGSLLQAVDPNSIPDNSSSSSSSGHQSYTVTWKVTNWFLQITYMLMSKGQDIVWMPHMKSFCKLPSKGKSFSSLFNSNSGGANSLFESENYQIPSQFSLFTETFLNHKELASLVKIVGIQVVRHIDEALLKLVAEKIEVLKVFIINNQEVLADLVHNVSAVETVLVSLKDGISSVFNCLQQLGVIFCVRDLLHESLGDCVAELSSLHEVTSIVDGIIASPFAQAQSQSTIQSLSYDFGNINSNKVDRALKSAIKNVFCNINDNHNLTLLPVVCSLAFLADEWKKSQYNPIYDVFTDNEHCIQVAIWKLHCSFFGREKFEDVILSIPFQSFLAKRSDATYTSTSATAGIGQRDDKVDSSASAPAKPPQSVGGVGGSKATSSTPPPPPKAGGLTKLVPPPPGPPSRLEAKSEVKDDKSDQVITSSFTGKLMKITIASSPSEIAKFDFDEHMGCFICLCSQFILSMKTLSSESSSGGKDSKLFPFEPLVVLLDSFVFTNRKMTHRAPFDVHIPFALVHHAAMNSSIGKTRPVDNPNLSLTYADSMRNLDDDDEAPDGK